ncbi:GNAT family N-acetyltransferase [Streptomyces sp. NPDC093591]|uniref:GNAT family N-acetyltransferase n=1 Tax=Streptomyces sp. NPDC093591 TaxID=3366044 RepID=UPI00380989B7
MDRFEAEERGPLEVRPLRPEDEPGVIRVMEACDDYLVTATGSPALPADVQSLYYALPDGADFEQKQLLVVCEGATVVGVVDAVEAHPDAATCSVGLFLLVPEVRREGLGTRVARHLLREAAARGLRRVTATCPESWTPGLAFLKSLGFDIQAGEEETAPTVGNRLRMSAERCLHTAVLDLPAGTDGAAAAADPGRRGTP